MPEPADGLHDDLIVRTAAGDREAFAELYRRFRPDVFRFALHMCGTPATAEDVVQDVFMAVIGAAARYRPGRSGALPWLLGIANNHVRRWRHRRLLLPLPIDGTAGVEESDPIGDLTRERHQVELTRALLQLPARYREVIVLCDLQELSYEAAASGLGCAVGTVRSRLHRGRALLARNLGKFKSDLMYRAPAARHL